MRNPRILAELLWWTLSLLLVLVIFYPIYLYKIHFPYWTFLGISIVFFVQFGRLILSMKHHPIRPKQLLKIVVMFLCIPIVFLLYQELMRFRSDLDDGLVNDLVNGLSLNDRRKLLLYIRSVVLYFGTASIMLGAVLPLRLLISVWKIRNKDKSL